MKGSALIVGLALLCACSEKAPEPIRYTWLGEHRSICFPDTITTLPKHTPNDFLLGSVEFTYFEGKHTLTGWTDGRDAPRGGGTFWVELDSIGTIYDLNMHGPDVGVIHSNSDSLNELIAMALAAASRPGKEGLRYPENPEPKIETVQFTADSVAK